MATPTWQPSTFYAPGSLVQPATAQPAVPTPIPNWSFESGNVEWTLDSGLSIVNGADHYGPGTWSLQGNPGFTGDRYAEMQDFIDCTPGESITAKCQVQQGASSAGLASGSVYLRFYDAANILIQENEGNIVNSGSGGAWHTSTVTATAPANTAFVRLATRINRIGENDPLWVDAFEWNKISQAQTGLIFKAVQANVGLSDATEPTWPLVNGQTVVDNTVTWEAVLATRIVWQAKPILVSGATEPAFTPTEGSTVGDNTISWRAVSRRVTDPNCPNSKIVIIGASKVFAADDDIVAYSATVNPLDWSTANNAGYIPSNLQQYGANPVAGLGLYRSNLWVGNSQGSQVWQIDEDPQQMALLDAFPVGTDYHDAVSPAFNDLFFLPSLGVRTLGIAGGSTNLQSGDAGMPIDTMVQDSLTQAKVNGDTIQALYYPAAGQYWLMFSPPTIPNAPIELSGSFDDGFSGTPYSSGPLTVTGGFAPFRWSLDSGTLQEGLELNEFTGIVSGTPTGSGVENIVVKVVDRFGREDTHPVALTIRFSSDIVTFGSGALQVRSGITDDYLIGQSIPSAAAPNDPGGISFSGDGTVMAVATSGSVKVFYRDTSGLFIEKVSPFSHVPTPASGIPICVSPDGQLIAYPNSNTELWIYRRQVDDTFLRIAQMSTSQRRFGLAFDPSSTYLMASGNTPCLLGFKIVANVVTEIFSGDTQDGYGLAWNADGTRFAYFPGNGAPRMYGRVGDVITILAIAGASISGQGMAVWGMEGDYIYCKSNLGAGFLSIWLWNGASLTRQTDPAVQPAGVDTLVDASIDGQIVTCSNGVTNAKIYRPDPVGSLTFLKDISPVSGTSGWVVNSARGRQV